MAGIKPTESKPVPLGFPVQILMPIADISKKIWALALYFFVLKLPVDIWLA